MPAFIRIILCISASFVLHPSPGECIDCAFLQPRSNGVVPGRSINSQLHLKKGGTKKKKVKGKTITINKLAYRNYEVLETLEVGIALRGTEVKR